MNTFQLYSNWHRALAQTLPDRCPSRLNNLTWLVVGLYLAMNVQLNAIVRKWPMLAKNASLTRRLERFLDNPAYRVVTGMNRSLDKCWLRLLGWKSR